MVVLVFLAIQSCLPISSGFDIKNTKLFRNMPQRRELSAYLKGFKSATEYSLNNKYEVDSNLALGIFISEGKFFYQYCSDNSKRTDRFPFESKDYRGHR